MLLKKFHSGNEIATIEWFIPSPPKFLLIQSSKNNCDFFRPQINDLRTWIHDEILWEELLYFRSSQERTVSRIAYYSVISMPITVSFSDGRYERPVRELAKCIFFFLAATPHSLQNLSFPPRDQTQAPCSRNAES